jgi:SagB-type dehydrogenase family enzyme
MRKHNLFSTVILMTIWVLAIFALSFAQTSEQPAVAQEKKSETEIIKLPAPKLDGTVSVEKALAERRSVRAYQDEPLSLAEVSQILWAAQGITDEESGKRTAPSARAFYFLDIYLVSGRVTDLPQGLYKYQPQGHQLLRVAEGDTKAKLFDAAGQAPIEKVPAALLVTGQSDRATNPNWMYLEAGHAAQNVYLQGISLGIGTVVMAGFKPEEVKKAMDLPENNMLIYIMPLGKK